VLDTTEIEITQQPLLETTNVEFVRYGAFKSARWYNIIYS
jgi:hypothetical protein